MIDKKHIIVVDDEEKALNGISRIIREYGYEVTTTRSAKEALESFNRKRYDLLITDIIINGMSGIDLLKEIRVVAPQTGVIVITGYGSMDYYLESMALGTFEYLNKPIDIAKLRGTITKYFNCQERPIASPSQTIRGRSTISGDL